jgi:hypothetical protein
MEIPQLLQTSGRDFGAKAAESAGGSMVSAAAGEVAGDVTEHAVSKQMEN